MSGHRSTTWARRIAALGIGCALLLTTAAGPAAAAPAGPGTTTGDSSTTPRVDNTKWPATLNWVIPGTPEFTARYEAGDTAGGVGVVAGTGCTAAHGGDAYRYTVDFFTNLGAILDAQATATGHGVMTIGDEQLPTAPWPGLATERGTAVLTLGSGEKVMATPGALIPMPSSGGALAGGAGVCADTLRAYGTPAAGAPFGFGFYDAPDQGSVDFLMTQLAGQQDLPAPVIGENTWTNPAQFYDPATGAENKLRTWEYSPLRFADYCTDENNPFCLTAAFLRCPPGDGANDTEAAAITACRTWNANVIILNQDIAMTLMTPGVGVPVDGDLDPLDAVARPGQQAPLDGWTAVAVGGRTILQAATMFYVGLGAAALIGGLVAGGIPGLLIAAGVIGVASVVLDQGIFGAVSCAQDFPKCMAAAGADGLVKTLALIPAAAGSTQVPDMTGPAMTTLLSTLGGISAGLVLVFFLISLLAAVLMHRPAQIWPAFFGLIGWGAAMGLGGAFLTMLITARGGVMTWLNTDGGAGTVLAGFPASVKESLTAIAADPTPGLLLAGLLSIVGIGLGVVVWVIVWVSGQWIPLVVALLVLQSAGMAAPGMPRKWLSRGFSVLWTLLLTPVMVLIIWRVGKVGLESNTGYLGLLSGVLVLFACAFSFLIVQRMLPMGEGAGMGIGAAVMSASYLAGRASSAARRPGPSREQLAQRQLEHGADPAGGGESGGGGGPGGPVPPALPSGAGAAGGSNGGGSTGGQRNNRDKGDPGNPPVGGGASDPADPGAPDSWVDRLTARLTNAAAQKIPDDPGETHGTPVADADSFPRSDAGAGDGGAGSTRATQAAARSASPASSTSAGAAQQHVPPAAADEGSGRDRSDRGPAADRTRQKAGAT
jgi:hypothetical protein